jgi:hypothetical protein
MLPHVRVILMRPPSTLIDDHARRSLTQSGEGTPFDR